MLLLVGADIRPSAVLECLFDICSEISAALKIFRTCHYFFLLPQPHQILCFRIHPSGHPFLQAACLIRWFTFHASIHVALGSFVLCLSLILPEGNLFLSLVLPLHMTKLLASSSIARTFEISS